MVNTNSLELENRKKILYKEIQQAYADAVAAFKNFTASEKAVAFMEESFMYTKEKYDVGLVNAVDFNIAQNQLTITRSDLLKAKYDYIFKINILNFYRGKELKLEY
jgi:outer membrane protein